MKKPVSNYDLQVDIGKRIFMEYDHEMLIRKYQLESDGSWIYLTYLNTPCRISREDGRIESFLDGGWLECRSYDTVMTIYDLLCHHKGEAAPSLSGQWCPVGTFIVAGITKTEGFTGKSARIFDGNVPQLKAACEALGGVLLPRMAGADVTCRFQATPFFPVVLQFWEGDDEFPAKLLVLWDRNTLSFLHFETTFYLQGDLLSRLRRLFEQTDPRGELAHENTLLR